MSLFHLCSPLFLLGPALVDLPLHLVLKSFGSKVLALAAAEQTDQEGDDEDSTNNRQRDDQRLEVHPAESPASIVEGAEGMWGQDGPHWVRHT